MENKLYDMLVIGGGPAGYTAAMYAARAGLQVLVLEKLYAGGQMTQTHQIDNYPGFADGIDGFTLTMQMKQQAERFGAESVIAQVQSLELTGHIKKAVTESGSYQGKTVVLAMGAGPKELGVENEKQLTSRGVAYCAACDGMFYRGKTVAVVGGGNTAAADALLLSRVAKKVYLIHRRDSLRATKIYHKALQEKENVQILYNTTVEKLHHDLKLTGVTVKDTLNGQLQEIACDGLFISVGRQPATEPLQGQIALDAGGYVVADESTCTNVPGVFAIGDVRTKEVRQIVTAVADGAVASHMAEAYLAQQ